MEFEQIMQQIFFETFFLNIEQCYDETTRTELFIKARHCHRSSKMEYKKWYTIHISQQRASLNVVLPQFIASKSSINHIN